MPRTPLFALIAVSCLLVFHACESDDPFADADFGNESNGTDADSDVDSDSDADGDSDSDSVSDSGGDTDGDADTDTDGDADTDTDGDADTDSDGDADTDSDGDTSADACVDNDGDWWCQEFDCNDGDKTVHPGAKEDTGDGIDNDCDGMTDEKPTGGSAKGCGGVDFLFIIDNSGSMDDEQANLKASFSGFMNAIVDTLELDDYHVMVVDTDADGSGGGTIFCSPAGCCTGMCASQPNSICTDQITAETKTCQEWLNPGGVTKCDEALGAGRIENAETSADCPYLGSSRYLSQGLSLTELNSGFQCIASVGTDGSGSELIMEAMVKALGDLDVPGGCNEGFIRDQAILVVTFITDEEDASSSGDPTTWKKALVDAKKGKEEGVVVLGLFGDNDLPSGICTEYDSQGNGAMAAPKLRQFVASFDGRGFYCSVCLTDYSSCFEDAVGLIDLTCENYPLDLILARPSTDKTV